jgi:hypothetical protein
MLVCCRFDARPLLERTFLKGHARFPREIAAATGARPTVEPLVAWRAIRRTVADGQPRGDLRLIQGRKAGDDVLDDSFSQAHDSGRKRGELRCRRRRNRLARSEALRLPRDDIEIACVVMRTLGVAKLSESLVSGVSDDEVEIVLEAHWVTVQVIVMIGKPVVMQ